MSLIALFDKARGSLSSLWGRTCACLCLSLSRCRIVAGQGSGGRRRNRKRTTKAGVPKQRLGQGTRATTQSKQASEAEKARRRSFARRGETRSRVPKQASQAKRKVLLRLSMSSVRARARCDADAGAVEAIVACDRGWTDESPADDAPAPERSRGQSESGGEEIWSDEEEILTTIRRHPAEPSWSMTRACVREMERCGAPDAEMDYSGPER